MVKVQETATSSVTMSSTQMVDCALQALTANNKPATLDGIPEWSTSNPAVAVVYPDSTGWQCRVKAVSPGVTTITAIGDAALDGSTRYLSATMNVQVNAAEADILNIIPGDVQDQ